MRVRFEGCDRDRDRKRQHQHVLKNLHRADLLTIARTTATAWNRQPMQVGPCHGKYENREQPSSAE